jgi:hypothetical protein
VTSENRLIIEPSDVTLIEFVCKGCGATLGRDPSNEKHFIPTECKNCDTRWLTDGSPLYQAVRGVVHGLREINRIGDESKVALRFHLKRPVTAPQT